jgi:hypothetical protein
MSGGSPKELLYGLVKQDSRNASNVGKALGWDYLEEEGKRNVKDPSAALRKAAISAATWYLGGAAGGALGGAEGAAGGAAGSAGSIAADTALQAGMTAGSEMTAQQLAQLAMQEMANPALAGAEQGLLSAAPEVAKEGALMVPQNLTMESGLTDTGYTPSNLYQAFKNASAENNTSLMQNLQNYGGQKAIEAQNGSMMNRMSSNMGNQKSRAMMNMGKGLLTPQQQQQPMPSRPAPQAPAEALPTPYGQPSIPPGQLAHLTEEQKRLLRMKGYRI